MYIGGVDAHVQPENHTSKHTRMQIQILRAAIVNQFAISPDFKTNYTYMETLETQLYHCTLHCV